MSEKQLIILTIFLIMVSKGVDKGSSATAVACWIMCPSKKVISERVPNLLLTQLEDVLHFIYVALSQVDASGVDPLKTTALCRVTSALSSWLNVNFSVARLSFLELLQLLGFKYNETSEGDVEVRLVNSTHTTKEGEVC